MQGIGRRGNGSHAIQRESNTCVREAASCRGEEAAHTAGTGPRMVVGTATAAQEQMGEAEAEAEGEEVRMAYGRCRWRCRCRC